MNLYDLENLHLGSDIWVIGSGPSLTYIDPQFFARKIVVATNRAADRLGLYGLDAQVYTHTHYQQEDAKPLAEKYPGHLFFTPNGEQGFEGEPTFDAPNVIFYPHPPTKYDFVVEEAVAPNGLLVGSTSLHGSMHLAAHMGAASIILVGADCGLIDGEANQTGHASGDLVNNDTLEWLARWNAHLIDVKRWITDKYPTRVYSLNPFVNLNLEGHTWTGVS